MLPVTLTYQPHLWTHARVHEILMDYHLEHLRFSRHDYALLEQEAFEPGDVLYVYDQKGNVKCYHNPAQLHCCYEENLIPVWSLDLQSLWQQKEYCEKQLLKVQASFFSQSYYDFAVFMQYYQTYYQQTYLLEDKITQIEEAILLREQMEEVNHQESSKCQKKGGKRYEKHQRR